MTQTTKKYSKTTYLVICGLFAALTAICSYITIPLGFTPVPINFALLGVYLAGGILGKKYGSLSIAVYLLMGAVGIPVFAGFAAGVGVLAGPTGGYLVGYLVAAFLIGLILDLKFNSDNKFAICLVALIIGLIACYTLGTIWFIISTGTGFKAALVACVIPFLPGDAVKIILASILIRKLRPLLN